MILIFTTDNELSTLEVAKRLKFFNKETYIINPQENIFKFSNINKHGIYFYNIIEKKEINLLNASACWWRRTGLGIENFFDINSSYNNLVSDKHNLIEILKGKQGILN